MIKYTLLRPALIVLLPALLTWASPLLAVDSVATVFLVRHAEKATQGSDPGLSQAGQQRARALQHSLSDAGIERVLSTDFNRTRETATPIARALGLEVEIYDHSKLAELATRLLQSGQRILVVGHSNTTPQLVQLLGADPGPEIDEKKEYDRLYVVRVTAGGSVDAVQLRYGAPSHLSSP